jgi:hypothetical protein
MPGQLVPTIFYDQVGGQDVFIFKLNKVSFIIVTIT